MQQPTESTSSMRDSKVVVMPLGIEVDLADELVEDINDAVGQDIAAVCEGAPKTILKRADRCSVEQVVFYGTTEMETGVMTVRDMSSYQQYPIPIDNLVAYFVACYGQN